MLQSEAMTRSVTTPAKRRLTPGAEVLALGWVPDGGWRWVDRSEVTPNGEREAPVSGLGMWLVPYGQPKRLQRAITPSVALREFLAIDPQDHRLAALARDGRGSVLVQDVRAALAAGPDQRPAQVAAFASKYGWLGRPQTLVAVDGGHVIPGEPLCAWLRELWLLRSLSDMLRACDRLERMGDWSTASAKAAQDELIAQAAHAGLPVRPGAARKAGPDALIRESRVAVRTALVPRLVGQFSAVLVADDGPVERFVPATLAAALELELARKATKSELPWVACAKCGTLFEQRRRDKIYCDNTCVKRASRAKLDAKRQRDREQAAQLEGKA